MMKCAECRYLKVSNKKNGAGGGAVYYCSKMEEYINGNCPACDKFSKSYCRTNFEIDDVIKDGYNYSKSECNPSFHFIVLVIIIIVGLTLKIFI